MGFTRGIVDGDLARRVEQLQARLERLEAVVLDESVEPEPLGSERPEPAAAFVVEQTAALAVESAEAGEVEAPRPAALVPATARTEPDRGEPRGDPAGAVNAPSSLRSSGPAPAGPGFDIRDIEERLAGRALALVGGTALLLGAVFFLSLAFSRGWVTPQMQVVLGLAGGSIGLLIGALLLFRGEWVVGHVLTAVGLAVISLSLFAATALYALIEPTLALAGVFVAASVTSFVAVRADSQVMAGFGLVAALGAPPIMGAEPDLITVAYVSVVLVSIAALSMWKTWWWLPPISFLLSVPQLARWIATEPELVLAVPALLAYWGLMTAAAGGEAFREGRRELSITSAPLFLAVGACVVGLAFSVLPADSQRAAFLLVLALLHGLVTAFFARRRGLLDPFGLLAGAYGLAMATAAVPLLLDASVTSVVWTAEAAALALFAGRRAHGPALIGTCVVYVLAAGHIGYQALLLNPVGPWMEPAIATGTVEGVLVAFAFFAAAATAILFLVPVRSIQFAIVGVLGLVAQPVVPLVLDGAAVVTVWMIIAVGSIGVCRWMPLLPEHRIRWRLGPALRWIRPRVDTTPAATLLPILAGGCAMGLALMGTIGAVVAEYRPPEVPFSNRTGLSGLALAAGFVSVGLVGGGMASRRRGVFAAGLVVGVISFTQLAAPWYVLVWVALATGAAWLSTIDTSGRLSYRNMALGSLVVLAVLALVEAPPTRLLVEAAGVAPHPLLVSEASLAVGGLIAALGLVAAVGAGRWPMTLVTSLLALAGAAGLYLLSVGVVDVFAAEAYELPDRQGDRLEELTKEAQVALSILWTSVGVVVLGIGLLLRRWQLRTAGLLVLGLATTKVFLVDLSSLDVAYRVITLLVLGLLLVMSAYAWSRMKPGGTAGPQSGPGHGYEAARSPRH